MVLYVYDLGQKVSRFKDNSWISDSVAIRLKEREVRTGEIGTFEFRLKSPLEPGLYKQIFILGLERKNIPVQDGILSLLTRVD